MKFYVVLIVGFLVCGSFCGCGNTAEQRSELSPAEIVESASEETEQILCEEETAAETEAYLIYQNFLDQITWTEEMIEPRFNLCWIDEDSIPELVVFTGLVEYEYTPGELSYTEYDYTVYTVYEGCLTELYSDGMQITMVGGFGTALVYEPRQNRLFDSTSSYRGAYEEIRQIRNGAVEVVESGYITYTGTVSGLFTADLYRDGVARSVTAETEDSPEYADFLALSEEVSAWMAENDSRQWVRSDPEVSFPVSEENGVRTALDAAAG